MLFAPFPHIPPRLLLSHSMHSTLLQTNRCATLQQGHRSSLPSPHGEVPSGMLSRCAAHGGDKRPSQASLLSCVGHKSELSSRSPQVAVSQRARRRTECQVGLQNSPAAAHTHSQIHTPSSFHRTHLEALQPRERATQCGGRRP